MDPSDQLVAVRVQPRASRERIQGLRGEAIAIQLKAAPVDGAANAALLNLLAHHLGVPLSCIELVMDSSAGLECAAG